MKPFRPAITGTRHMISAGHHGAAHAGFCILEAGGNAVDAGVAAGICLSVLQADIVNVAGVAPIMLWLASAAKSSRSMDGGHAATRCFSRALRPHAPGCCAVVPVMPIPGSPCLKNTAR
jgi:gamma-glutamyltranspeptidase/glutathione hydrolase